MRDVAKNDSLYATAGVYRYVPHWAVEARLVNASAAAVQWKSLSTCYNACQIDSSFSRKRSLLMSMPVVGHSKFADSDAIPRTADF